MQLEENNLTQEVKKGIRFMELSAIITAIGVLVALTNIVVEVFKKLTYDKMPTNVLAVIVAEILTIALGVAYFQISNIAIIWYMIVALIITGFLVSYAAMFGFDKLKEIMHWKGSEMSE